MKFRSLHPQNSFLTATLTCNRVHLATVQKARVIECLPSVPSLVVTAKSLRLCSTLDYTCLWHFFIGTREQSGRRHALLTPMVLLLFGSFRLACGLSEPADASPSPLSSGCCYCIVSLKCCSVPKEHLPHSPESYHPVRFLLNMRLTAFSLPFAQDALHVIDVAAYYPKGSR